MPNFKKLNPAVLLICADFFSYHDSIIKTLEARGVSVVWWNDRVSNNPIYKIFLRIMPRLVSRLSTQVFTDQIKGLEANYILDVLVIKGEGLSSSAVRNLRKAIPNARFHLYLWDGIENVPMASELAPFFDNISTFDTYDAQRFGWRYRPLFARNSNQAPASLSETWVYDCMFVGSLHSDRYSVLKNLVVSSTHLRMFVYGFIPGRLVWWLRHLLDWSLWNSGVIKISTTPLTPKVIQEILNSSCAVIDIEHPRQRGLTMRSIETLMAHRKLITTNKNIRHTDLYHESRVLIIDRKESSISKEFLESSFLPLDPLVRERYSLGSWVDDVLNNI